MRRHDREITDRTEIEAALDAAQIMSLGLFDGEEPYVVPVNFVRVGGLIYFHGAREGRKHDIIAAHPKVCFEATSKSVLKPGTEPCNCTTYYESVIGWGTASRVADENEKTAALAAMNRKFGAKDGPFPPAMLEATAVVRIVIERMTGKAKRGVM